MHWEWENKMNDPELEKIDKKAKFNEMWEEVKILSEALLLNMDTQVKLRRKYYEGLIKEGFNEKEALELTKAFSLGNL